jgi:hypothetical protein
VVNILNGIDAERLMDGEGVTRGGTLAIGTDYGDFMLAVTEGIGKCLDAR